MEDTAKYLINARLVADGVVERTDVVGAVFGQTEGLLGDDLDIPDLQESSRLGRIDVEVESEGGRSEGRITIASSMDRVETAVLAASLEAIERIGPCRSDVQIEAIRDVRADKRRAVVDRAKEILATQFDDGGLDSEDILEEVRESVRVARITEYEGLPAGPRVADGDALIVVEGRADVKTLLRYGVKNGVAVEGTGVPDAIAALTRDRTTTAFLDGDRGGDLLLRELAQVGDVDYVARPPSGQSVEDLSRAEVDAALRAKARFEPDLLAGDDATEAGAETPEAGAGAPDAAGATESDATDEGSREERASVGTDGAGVATAADSTAADSTAADATPEAETSEAETPETETPAATGDVDGSGDGQVSSGSGIDVEEESDQDDDPDVDGTEATERAESVTDGCAAPAGASDPASGPGPAGASGPGSQWTPASTLSDRLSEAREGSRALLLDESLGVLEDVPAGDAFEAVVDADVVPAVLVVDGAVTQRLVDVASQRGVARVVGTEAGEFVKQPAAVRVLTHDDLD